MTFSVELSRWGVARWVLSCKDDLRLYIERLGGMYGLGKAYIGKNYPPAISLNAVQHSPHPLVHEARYNCHGMWSVYIYIYIC